MNALQTESAAEWEISEAVRRELERRFEEDELTMEDAATRLRLHVAGVDSMMLRYWDFAEAFRIALHLDIDFAEIVRERQGRPPT